MHVVIAFTCLLFYCVTLLAYSMCWPVSGCNISCCRLFRRRVRCARTLSCTQLCRWSWWTHSPLMLPQLSYLVGLKPYYSNKLSFETFDVISVWLHSVINPSSTVFVSITDPGMALMHRDLTVWGRIATLNGCGSNNKFEVFVRRVAHHCQFRRRNDIDSCWTFLITTSNLSSADVSSMTIPWYTSCDVFPPHQQHT